MPENASEFREVLKEMAKRLGISLPEKKVLFLNVPTRKKNPAAASLGKLGGKARAKALSKEELSAIALKGARARWGSKGKAKARTKPQT
jgi:hypothetical protein